MALTVAAAVGVLSFPMYRAVTAWGNAAPAATFEKLDAALDTVNRPCSPGPCGTLANVDKAVVKVGDILVTSQMQERDVAKAAQQNMAAVNTLSVHLNTATDALAEAARGVTSAIHTVDEAAKAAKPLESSLTSTAEASTAALYTLNRRFSDPRVDTLIDNFRQLSGNAVTITGNLGQTTGDFQLRFHAFLFPPPCRSTGCRLAKTFTILKDASEFAAPSYWAVKAARAAMK